MVHLGLLYVNLNYSIFHFNWVSLVVFFRDPTYEPPHKERKFIVFETALIQLFTVCFTCFSTNVKAPVIKVTGSFISVLQTCLACGKKFWWSSQPMIGNIPAGNILLSASILFAGALPSKTIRVLTSCGIQSISLTSYFRHQKKFLVRTVSNVWFREEKALLERLKNKKLVLGGDGRHDSMGHSAKYGSYTIMELEENKIINIQVVQVLKLLKIASS